MAIIVCYVGAKARLLVGNASRLYRMELGESIEVVEIEFKMEHKKKRKVNWSFTKRNSRDAHLRFNTSAGSAGVCAR